MKKILLSLVTTLFCTLSYADMSAVAGSLSSAGAISGATSAANQGNAQNLTINSAPYPTRTTQEVISSGTVTHNNVGTSTLKTAPQVYAPPMGVTAPCRVALSAGVSVIGVGVAAGGSVPDAPCNLRELSRTYHTMGQTEKAIKVADGALALECLDETVAKALGNLCSSPVQQPSPVVTPVSTSKVEKCSVTTDNMGIKTTVCKES